MSSFAVLGKGPKGDPGPAGPAADISGQISEADAVIRTSLWVPVTPWQAGSGSEYVQDVPYGATLHERRSCVTVHGDGVDADIASVERQYELAPTYSGKNVFASSGQYTARFSTTVEPQPDDLTGRQCWFIVHYDDVEDEPFRWDWCIGTVHDMGPWLGDGDEWTSLATVDLDRFYIEPDYVHVAKIDCIPMDAFVPLVQPAVVTVRSQI